MNENKSWNSFKEGFSSVVVVVVEFFNKTSSNAKQTMKMQADYTDTKWASI